MDTKALISPPMPYMYFRDVRLETWAWCYCRRSRSIPEDSWYLCTEDAPNEPGQSKPAPRNGTSLYKPRRLIPIFGPNSCCSMYSRADDWRYAGNANWTGRGWHTSSVFLDR